MNVFVTGSTGYVGSNFVRHLLESGRHRVFCLYRSGAKQEELSSMLGRTDSLTWVRSDLADLTCLPGGVDVIVHSAGRRGIGLCQDDSAEAIRCNVEGTRRLVESARKARVRRFIYVSSQSVYGDDIPCPWTEESATRPASVYAVTKYAGELISASLCESGVGTFILRPARVYGAGSFMVDEGVVAAFTRAVADSLPLTVRGSGRQKTSLIHIDDLCRLLVRLLDLDDDAGNSARRPRAELVRVYNACGESGITVDQLADAFIAAGTGIGLPRAVKRYAGLPAGVAEPQGYWLDGSKAQAELGWKPCVPLHAGVTGLLGTYLSSAGRPAR